MRYFVTFPDGVEVTVDVAHLPTGETKLAVGDRVFDADVHAAAQGGSLNVRVDGRVVDLWIEGTLPDIGVVVPGHRFYAKVESERMRALGVAGGAGKHGGEGLVRSPMPGRVLKVLVAEGDAVAVGTALCVVEAMKMENELSATRAGTVRKVFVTAGDTVEGGAKLVEIG